MQNQPTPSPKILFDRGELKKYFIIATIILICACAFLSILMIFFGTSSTLLKVISTLLIMYAVLTYSTNNLVRMESPLTLVRALSVMALIANFFWSVLWILVVWGAFGSCSFRTQELVWKIIGTAMVFSVFCSILSAKIVKMEGQPAIIKFFKSLPLVCAALLGLDLLIVIWAEELDVDLIWKLILVEIILVGLQAIITSILKHNAERLGIKESSQPRDLSSQSTQSSQISSIISETQDGTQANQTMQNSETSSQSTVVQEQTYEDELRERIEQEVRAKIAAEQSSQQSSEPQKTT